MTNILLTAGPTNVPEDIAAALAWVDHSHRDAEVAELLARVRRGVIELLGGAEGYTAIPLACSGTGANEALIGTVAGRVLVLDAGRYSSRLADIAARQRVPCETLRFDAWSGIDLARVDALLAAHPDVSDVFAVHLETTTGALAPLTELGDLVHRRGRRLLVDAISSAFGHPLDLVRDHITACTITPNKCLEAAPGIAMVVAESAWLGTLEGRARSYYFDLDLHARQLAREGTPAFTVSPGILAATDVALARLRVEGVGGRAARYRGLRDQLRRLLTDHGIELRVPARDSNIITVFALPRGLDATVLTGEMAAAGFVVHSHDELTSAGLFGVATFGALPAAEVARFADRLCALREARR